MSTLKFNWVTCYQILDIGIFIEIPDNTFEWYVWEFFWKDVSTFSQKKRWPLVKIFCPVIHENKGWSFKGSIKINIFIFFGWLMYFILSTLLDNIRWPNVDQYHMGCWKNVCWSLNSLRYFMKSIKHWYQFVRFLSQ